MTDPTMQKINKLSPLRMHAARYADLSGKVDVAALEDWMIAVEEILRDIQAPLVDDEDICECGRVDICDCVLEDVE